ncbi:MotA/TolQ/ExbB proton channel family protein [Bacteriovoracaceae bacterium]|nr:MotA/TolQ/ExbB proton channel family protein [Bacteriovoracaceae bacterium]
MPIWMVIVEWSARIILLMLVLLSVWSFAIILDRKKIFNTLLIKPFLDELIGVMNKVNPSFIDQAISKNLFQKKIELEKGLAILGTLGSTTPFIGLLGTILGIIVAFGELSQGKGDTNSIMFALAEALILTAVGLFVAIPAVIAFNYFNKKIKIFFDEVSSEIDFHQSNINKKENN